MRKRRFGNTTIELSEVSFGSMRFDPKKMTSDEGCHFLDYLISRGIDTFHSSHEYETHRFFVECLREVRKNHSQIRFRHICKLAVPHFEEESFSAERFEAVIGDYQRDFDGDHIDIVQWLFRTKPLTDELRLKRLADSYLRVQEAIEKCLRVGSVSAVASFPYSLPFAKAVLELEGCKGLVTYLNPLEREMAPYMDSFLERGKGFVAIRPFKGGELAKSISLSDVGYPEVLRGKDASLLMRESIRYSLLHPAVASTIVSVSTCAHLDQLLSFIENLKPDQQAFRLETERFDKGI